MKYRDNGQWTELPLPLTIVTSGAKIPDVWQGTTRDEKSFLELDTSSSALLCFDYDINEGAYYDKVAPSSSVYTWKASGDTRSIYVIGNGKITTKLDATIDGINYSSMQVTEGERNVVCAGVRNAESVHYELDVSAFDTVVIEIDNNYDSTDNQYGFAHIYNIALV